MNRTQAPHSHPLTTTVDISGPQERISRLPADTAMDVTSDQSLVLRVRSGDDEAAHELYSRYVRRLFGLVEAKMGNRLRAKTTSEDIVQSVFKSIFRGVKSGHYDAPPGESLWNLMAIVAVHKLSRLGQRHSAQSRDSSKDVSYSSFENEIANQSLSPETLEVSVRDVLDHFRPLDRTILQLRLEQHTVGEIAETISRSRRSVERSLQKIRIRLTELMASDDID